MKYKNVTPHIIEQITPLYLDGMSKAEICRLFSIDPKQFNNIINKIHKAAVEAHLLDKAQFPSRYKPRATVLNLSSKTTPYYDNEMHYGHIQRVYPNDLEGDEMKIYKQRLGLPRKGLFE